MVVFPALDERQDGATERTRDSIVTDALRLLCVFTF
jgi:hypothetical protein